MCPQEFKTHVHISGHYNPTLIISIETKNNQIN